MGAFCLRLGSMSVPCFESKPTVPSNITPRPTSTVIPSSKGYDIERLTLSSFRESRRVETTRQNLSENGDVLCEVRRGVEGPGRKESDQLKISRKCRVELCMKQFPRKRVKDRYPT